MESLKQGGEMKAAQTSTIEVEGQEGVCAQSGQRTDH